MPPKKEELSMPINPLCNIPLEEEDSKQISGSSQDPRHSSLIEYMRNGYAHCRMTYEEDGSVDFIHIEVNEGYERLTGLKNVIGLKLREVFPGIDKSNPEFIEKHRKVVESGISDQFEVYLQLLEKWYDITVYSPWKGESIAIFDDITRRKDTEEALKQSEAQFKGLFKGHSSVMLVIDAYTGNITDANQSAAAFYGWSIDELKRMNIQDINALPQDIVESNLVKYRDARQYRFHFTHRKSDGSTCPVEVLSNTIEANGRVLYYSIITDITDRLKTVEALRKSEERFRLMFENHSAVMILLDPETGRIVDANRAAAEFYGWSIDVLKGMRIQEITNITPNEVQVNLEKSRTSEQNRFTFIHKRADESRRSVEVFSKSINFDGKELLYAIIHDITLRVHAEKALKKSEKQLDQQYHTLIAASPDSIITTDLEGIIKSVSDVGLDTFGASSRSEVIGIPFSRIVYEDNLTKIQEILKETLHKGLTQNRELLLKKMNNTVYAAEISAALILDHDGIPSSYMMIIRDISQRKIIESELFHAKRLSSLGEMASGIAHEIYQPINNIGLIVEKLLMDATKNSWSGEKEIKVKSEKIFENILRVQTIIDNIRSFSSADKNYISSVININVSIRNALMMVTEHCKSHGIILSFKPEQHRFPVTGNIYKFEQVILNLIKNSIDALEEKKQVREFPFEMKILVKSFYDNDLVTITVEDTGIGIGEKNIENIMHPFYTTKESGKGTGLGLSISYGIIKEMNGDIRIKSTPMAGTTVVITLPASAK